MKRGLYKIAVLTLTLLFVVPPGKILALSEAQQKIFGQHIPYYNVDECSTLNEGNSQNNTAGADLSGKNVYMVGDSITEITTPNLTKAFKDAGADPHIDSTGGSSIVYPAAGRSGLQWVDFHKEEVKKAGIIVIAHGTNEIPSALEGDMKKMIKEVKKYNNSGLIYWVNTFTTQHTSNPAYTAEGAAKKNKIIERLAPTLGYTVIDAKSANIQTTDGIHPFNDKEKYAKTIVKGITSDGGAGGGQGNLSTAAAGNLPAEGKDVGATEYTGSMGYKGDNLTNGYAYAELVPGGHGTATESTATAMGGLKYKQKLLITYNNKAVVAEKLDIGLGGGPIGGKPRAIDLHFDKTASALGISSPSTWSGVVHVQGVSDDTPLGPANPANLSSPAQPTSSQNSCCQGAQQSGNLEGNTPAEQAFNYFVSLGLTPAQSAGIVGNLMVESGGNTEQLDTHAHNDISGTHDGIAQWDSGRWASLKQYVRENPITPDKRGDAYYLGNQLAYLWHELKTTESSALHAIQNANTAQDAALQFQNEFERCGDAAACAQSYRTSNAQQIFNRYGGGGGTSGSGVSSNDNCSSPAGNTGTCNVNAPLYGSVHGSGDEYTQEQLTKIFGDPGTASDHSSMDKNLVNVSFLGHSVQANKLIAPCLEAVASDISSKNIHYHVREVGCYRFDSNNGSSNIGLKSYHTYGAACDINWDTNPFVDGGASAAHDMPEAYVKAFHDHGFTWGGDWVSVKDYMHFEFNGIKP